MAHGGCNYFSFWTIFCPFTPPPPSNSPKTQKKFKKSPEDIIILYMCTKYHDHIMYCTPPHTHTHLTSQKINFLKKQQKCLEISSFYIYVPQIMIRWSDDVRFLRYGMWRTGGHRKWHIEVGAPPKKKNMEQINYDKLQYDISRNKHFDDRATRAK